MESGLYGVRHDGRIVRHLATITPLRRFVRVVSRLRASLVRAAGCVAPYRAGRYIGRVVISRFTGTLLIPSVFAGYYSSWVYGAKFRSCAMSSLVLVFRGNLVIIIIAR